MALSEGDGGIGGDSLSVVIPAFNEAPNLASVIQSVHEALQGKISEYEIIVVDDGSMDDTGKVAEALAEHDPRLRVIHNPRNMGYGFTFLRGVGEARCEYVGLVPGDGEISADAIATIASEIGKADMVIPYMLNFHTRPLSRRVISWGYTALLNILFRQRIHYYNGPFVIRREFLIKVPVNTSGFAFMASIVLRLIKWKCTYVEVGIMLQPRRFGRSSFSLRKIAAVVRIVCWLFWDISIAERFRKSDTNRPGTCLKMAD